MCDYEELVDKLRFYANTADDPIYGICINSPKVMFQAADAIEQLTKQRDAAMSGIPTTCGYCAHEDDEEWCERGCRWEWRGVRSEENVR